MSRARKSGRTRTQRREQEHAAQREALEQARAAAVEEEPGSTMPRARRGRWILLGIPVVLALVAVGVVVFAGGSATKKDSSGAPTRQESEEAAKAREALAAVNEVLTGVPQHGNVLGDPRAPVTLEYFGDLESSPCRQFTLAALPTIIEKWVRADDVRIVYRSLETTTREPKTFALQQAAALAAGKQNEMWYFVELFYQEQGEEGTGYVTGDYLRNLAGQIPALNIAHWATAVGSKAIVNQLEGDRRTAGTLGFTSTPAFLLGHTGRKLKELLIRSVSEPRGFDEAIEALLRPAP